MSALRAGTIARCATVVALITATVLLLRFSYGGTTAVAQIDSTRADVPHAKEPTPDDECASIVREIYGTLGELPGSDSMLTYTCTTEFDVVDTVRYDHGIHVTDISQNAARTRVASEYFEMDRDSHEVFVVIPASRTVFRNAAIPADDVAGLPHMPWMRDTLLANSMIVSCRTSTDSAGHAMRVVLISPDPDVRRMFGIDSLEIGLDVDRRLVQRIAIVPVDRREYTRLEWRFGERRIALADSAFRAPVAKRFLLNEQKLSSQWRGFELVDNRNVAAALQEIER